MTALTPTRRDALLHTVRIAGALDARDAHAPRSLDRRWELLRVALPQLDELDEVGRVQAMSDYETAFRTSSGYLRVARPVAGCLACRVPDDPEDTLVDAPAIVVQAHRRYVYGHASKPSSWWRRLLGLACLALCACGGVVGPADVTGDAGDSTDAAPAPLCVAPGIATCAARWGYQCYPVVAAGETLCASGAHEVWCCTEYPLGDR